MIEFLSMEMSIAHDAIGVDIHLKVLEAKGIGAKGIPIQRYSKAKGIWNNIFTSPKEP